MRLRSRLPSRDELVTRDGDLEVTPPDSPRDRRHLLKILGATAAGAVGASLVEASPAGAADGDPVAMGTTNTCTSTTMIESSDGTGIYGTANNVSSLLTPGTLAGVIGDSDTVQGVMGLSSISSGVMGETSGTDQAGVFGFDASADATSFGVAGVSDTGCGLFARGALAPLYLSPSGSAGAPTTGAHSLGQIYVDENGVFYKCAAAGTPGSWVPMYSSIPLSVPIRVFDSRTSDPPAAPSRAVGPVGGGTTQPLQITGTSVGGIEVPSGAVGVIGNVTVVHAVASGYLTLYPSGVPRPTTSSLNYPDANPICNGTTVALSSAGVLDVFAAITTDVIFDVTGFIV